MDTDFQFRDATFPTGIDSSVAESDSDVLRLPDVVNFVALRETCLSEAPFVTRSSRKFWKKWMDSSQYITILCATLKILNSCINDVGSVDATGLYELQDNPLMDKMCICVAEMLVMDRKRHSRSHDNLFRRLPELLCYMLVNSLLSCNPRQARVFNSVQFRELLLDWLGELIGGLRQTNCQSDREWLFLDTNEAPLILTNGNFLTTAVPMTGNGSVTAERKAAERKARLFGNSGTIIGTKSHTQLNGTGGNSMPADTLDNEMRRSRSHTGMSSHGGGDPASSTNNNSNNNNNDTFGASHNGVSSSSSASSSSKNVVNKRTSGGSISHFSVGNSPLVNMYMNLGRQSSDHPYVCAYPVKIIMTTQPERPLTTMTPESLLKQGAYREKIIDAQQLNRSLRTSQGARKQILKQFDKQRTQTRRDMRHANETLRLQYAMLHSTYYNARGKSSSTSSPLQAATSAGILTGVSNTGTGSGTSTTAVLATATSAGGGTGGGALTGAGAAGIGIGIGGGGGGSTAIAKGSGSAGGLGIGGISSATTSAPSTAGAGINISSGDL